MNIDLVFRLIGMAILGGLGITWGIYLGKPTLLPTIGFAVLGGLIGLTLGWFITPFLTTKPARMVRNRLSKVPAPTLIAGLSGLVVGLVVAALLSMPLSSLPEPLGNILTVAAGLLASYLGIALFVTRQDDIMEFFHISTPRKETQADPQVSASQPEAVPAPERTILLDTSVIIDGRIADVARTGFLVGTLLIPRFVLNELQYIADSSDGLRRQRGRRGMEVLSQLQKDATLPVHISDLDVEGLREVDEKLVTLARQLKAAILTNDYNLNRVAELQGVTVLNVNELANAVKTVLLPGENLVINIIQEGRESGQGLAYLEDGTMVVVEDGRDFIGSEKNVIVTKVLQTSAGRMIFARPETEKQG